MFSLAHHPDAICGGELCNDTEAQNCPGAWAAKRRGDWNLCKILGYNHPDPRCRSAMRANACVVYLFRRDRAAQLASWRKACETGVWVPGQTPAPAEFPADADQQIADSGKLFQPRATLSIAYEDMIADWDGTIASILTAAGWEVMELPQALAEESAE